MKKQVKFLLFTYIISIIVSFILGFFITNLVNNERGIYVSNFSYVGEKELNFNEIINEDFLNSAKTVNFGPSIESEERGIVRLVSSILSDINEKYFGLIERTIYILCNINF